MAGSPYGPTVLDHARRPRNRGSLPAPTIAQEGRNAECGDRVRLELRLEGDVVAAARFTASACAICLAATSMLTEMVQRAPLEDIGTLTVPELVAALGSPIPRTRLACVRLPLTVLHGALRLHELREGKARASRA